MIPKNDAIPAMSYVITSSRLLATIQLKFEVSDWLALHYPRPTEPDGNAHAFAARNLGLTRGFNDSQRL
jgi:hypothetical protein